MKNIKFKRIFNITNLCLENKRFKRITILGSDIYFARKPKILFHWEKAFRKYFRNNDIQSKIANLKEGLDDISCEYIDKFFEIEKYWNKHVDTEFVAWSNYDLKLMEKYGQQDYKAPFGDITSFNPFIFQNQYGLIDLPKDVLEKIDGKDIIDAGGLNGDTAVMLADMFPKSKVYVYEPLIENIKTINEIITAGNYQDRMIPIQKGLGNESGVIEFHFNHTNTAEIVPLDKDYKGDNLGLIKMDTEGFESQITEGAKELIKKHKPVLAIAIYHTPEDFFEMKDKIKSLNPDYKFMIRRSEQVIPTADLVLIAYPSM